MIREELPGTAIIVLSAHVEVDEAMDLLERLGSARGRPHDCHALSLEENARRLEEGSVVINQQTPRWHSIRVAGIGRGRIAASRNSAALDARFHRDDLAGARPGTPEPVDSPTAVRWPRHWPIIVGCRHRPGQPT